MDLSELITQLDAMKEIDIKTVDRDSLRDIREIKIHTELPKKERILDFIQQIGNPYCFRYGDYVIKLSFTDTEVTLEDRIISWMRLKYESEIDELDGE